MTAPIRVDLHRCPVVHYRTACACGWVAYRDTVALAAGIWAPRTTTDRAERTHDADRVSPGAHC